MSIFDEYKTREELLRAVEGAITAQEDGAGGSSWRLADEEHDALRRRVETADRGAARERRRREELEERLAKADRERADVDAELERLRALNAAAPADDADLRGAVRRYAEQAAVSRNKLAALEAQLAPLREENARYKERETRAAIEAQLVDAARKLDCCETAMRDVRRLAANFRLNEEGLAVADDSRSAADVLRDEIALSPHWLNRSRGGAASPGAEPGGYGDRDRFLDALGRGDFADAIRFAPRG